MTTWRRSVTRRITRFLRCSATGRSATTSKRVRSITRGSSPPKSSVSTPSVSGRASTRMTPSSERLWVERIGVPRERISRLTENWWAAGPTGPCGYDSELYFDWGGPCSCGRTDCIPQDECGGDRFEEFWNLVFMEFDQQADGSRPLLPNPTVDTGLGIRPDRRDRAGRPDRIWHRPLRSDRQRLQIPGGGRRGRSVARAVLLRARRPSPWRRVSDRRRSAPRQRGTRLRAPPARPPSRGARSSRRASGWTRRRHPGPRDGHGTRLPGARRVSRADRGDAAHRGGGLRTNPRRRHGAPRRPALDEPDPHRRRRRLPSL